MGLSHWPADLCSVCTRSVDHNPCLEVLASLYRLLGILDSEKRVDQARNSELVELAAPLPCTFHRATDEVDNLDEAVQFVIQCGFRSILTSGGKKNAVLGMERVSQLQEKFGNQIDFILGGGVRSTNAEQLRRTTRVAWIHSAATTKAGEEVDSEEVTKLRNVLSQII